MILRPIGVIKKSYKHCYRAPAHIGLKLSRLKRHYRKGCVMEDKLESKVLFELTVDLGIPHQIENTPHGNRRIFYITGGKIKGQRLSGEILPGGSDWALFRPDGVLELDVRAVFRTDDGQLVCMYPKGLINIPPDLLSKVRDGQPVDSSKYYFRAAYFFETSSEKYAWLNKILAVGVLGRTTEGISGVVYEIV